MDMNRREFLRTAGKAALGAVAVSSLPLPVVAEGKETPVWPWKYVPLDKDELLKRCYEKFFEYGGCGGGCFGGIIDIMSEVTGYPYNEIAPGRVCALMGGGFGAGTLCGSLAGALMFVGLVCEPQDAATVRDQLFAWYREHSFPQYQPEFESITTVAHSINCVDSVGTYMAATGYKMADPERKARCASVTAEVAVKAISLLNVLYGYEEPEPEEEAAPAEETLAANEYIGTGVSEIGGEVKVN